MKVEVIYRSDPERELYDPLPEKPGDVFRLLRGDVMWAAGGNWLKEPYHTFVALWRDCKLWLPFYAWHARFIFLPKKDKQTGRWSWKRWTGCVGAKVVQLNDPRWAPGTFQYPQYRELFRDEDLQPGSQVLQPCFRPGASPE